LISCVLVWRNDMVDRNQYQGRLQGLDAQCAEAKDGSDCDRFWHTDAVDVCNRMSAVGTKRPNANELPRSVLKGKADVVFSGPNSRS
jgi:hypothetical protein